MAKALYAVGQTLYTARLIKGTLRDPADSILLGSCVRILEVYAARGETTRYLVGHMDNTSRRAYVYEDDLSQRDPLGAEVSP